MATYTVDTTSNTILSGEKYTFSLGFHTYSTSRGFTQFDLSHSKPASAKLRTYVETVLGPTNNFRLRSATGGNGWGASLTQADWGTTSTNLEVANKSIGSTGWQEWDVDPDNLDLTGTNYYRTSASTEHTTTGTRIYYRSQNASSNKPHLRLTYDAAPTYTGAPNYLET